MAEIHHLQHGWVTPTISYVLSVLGSLLGLTCAVRLRNAPTPLVTPTYDGSGQATHPGIAHFPGRSRTVGRAPREALAQEALEWLGLVLTRHHAYGVVERSRSARAP